MKHTSCFLSGNWRLTLTTVVFCLLPLSVIGYGLASTLPFYDPTEIVSPEQLVENLPLVEEADTGFNEDDYDGGDEQQVRDEEDYGGSGSSGGVEPPHFRVVLLSHPYRAVSSAAAAADSHNQGTSSSPGTLSKQQDSPTPADEGDAEGEGRRRSAPDSLDTWNPETTLLGGDEELLAAEIDILPEDVLNSIPPPTTFGKRSSSSSAASSPADRRHQLIKNEVDLVKLLIRVVFPASVHRASFEKKRDEPPRSLEREHHTHSATAPDVGSSSSTTSDTTAPVVAGTEVNNNNNNNNKHTDDAAAADIAAAAGVGKRWGGSEGVDALRGAGEHTAGVPTADFLPTEPDYVLDHEPSYHSLGDRPDGWQPIVLPNGTRYLCYVPPTEGPLSLEHRRQVSKKQASADAGSTGEQSPSSSAASSPHTDNAAGDSDSSGTAHSNNNNNNNNNIKLSRGQLLPQPMKNEIDKALSNHCVRLRAGWWTYELCWNRYAVQFHDRLDWASSSTNVLGYGAKWSLAGSSPSGGGKATTSAGPNFLASQAAKAHQQQQQQKQASSSLTASADENLYYDVHPIRGPYIATTFTNGTVCDLTKKQRTTEVRLQCSSNTGTAAGASGSIPSMPTSSSSSFMTSSGVRSTPTTSVAEAAEAETMMEVLEPETCNYLIWLSSPVACFTAPLTKNPRPVTDIRCLDIADVL